MTTENMKLPTPLDGLTRGVWHPQLVGAVRSYPKTEAAFLRKQAAGRAQAAANNAKPRSWSRKGVQSADRAAGVEWVRQAARDTASAMVDQLQDRGLISAGDEENRTRQYLTGLLGIVLDRTSAVEVSAKALGMVLEFLGPHLNDAGCVS